MVPVITGVDTDGMIMESETADGDGMKAGMKVLSTGTHVIEMNLDLVMVPSSVWTIPNAVTISLFQS